MTIQEAQDAFDACDPGTSEALRCLNNLIAANHQRHCEAIATDVLKTPPSKRSPQPDAKAVQTSLDL